MRRLVAVSFERRCAVWHAAFLALRRDRSFWFEEKASAKSTASDFEVAWLQDKTSSSEFVVRRLPSAMEGDGQRLNRRPSEENSFAGEKTNANSPHSDSISAPTKWSKLGPITLSNRNANKKRWELRVVKHDSIVHGSTHLQERTCNALKPNGNEAHASNLEHRQEAKSARHLLEAVRAEVESRRQMLGCFTNLTTPFSPQTSAVCQGCSLVGGSMAVAQCTS